MSYLAFARKYRPGLFASVKGQIQVTRTLENAILQNRIVHAYLFCGPRGVGKTSVARIFSKALNCLNTKQSEPCGLCHNCLAIDAGQSMAVFEIDGASHNSVDDVRGLTDSLRVMPPPGWEYKIYIIDEVHMLSQAAFNALLKSLEEPPPKTVFILATTESHKVPATVASRCQKHDFKSLPVEQICEKLKSILDEQKIPYEPEAVLQVARLADGAMRDGESLLDRVVSFSPEKISMNGVSDVLGVAPKQALIELSHAILTSSAGEALGILSKILSQGIDARMFLEQLLNHFHELLLISYDKPALIKTLFLTEETLTALKRQARIRTQIELARLFRELVEGGDTALRSSYPRYLIEALVAQLTNIKAEPHSIATKTDKEPAAATSTPVTISQKTYSWGEFISSLSKDGTAKLFLEQLKLLKVIEFSSGVLRALGEPFCVSYLLTSENAARLLKALQQYYPAKNWIVDIKSGSGNGETSVREQEQSALQAEANQAAKHSSVSELVKLFPGSAVEKVKLSKG